MLDAEVVAISNAAVIVLVFIEYRERNRFLSINYRERNCFLSINYRERNCFLSINYHERGSQGACCQHGTSRAAFLAG